VAYQYRRGDVIYPDRADEDKSSSLIRAHPWRRTSRSPPSLVTLLAGSDAEDGAFFAYLEDVSETGRVTYITKAS